MSGPAYVFELNACPDQATRGNTLKAAVEKSWPGSAVELRPHPMGGLRARITLVDDKAEWKFRTMIYLELIAEGFRLFASPYPDDTL